MLDSTPLVVFSKSLSGSNQYIFEADLPVDVVLGAGSYWVSIVDTTPGVDFSFNGSNESGANTYHSTTDQTSGYNNFSGPQRINVIGDDTRFDASVPEPSCLLMTLVGAGLVARRRR